MDVNVISCIISLVALALFGAIMFSLGTRVTRQVDNLCHLKVHWWFGWWASCRGDCPNSGHDCALQWRAKGSEDRWQDENTRTKKWDATKEYRCVCRPRL